MTQHIIDLYCTSHALLDAVLNPTPVSRHSSGVLAEAAIKQGSVPDTETFLQVVRHLAIGEQNYLVACYIAFLTEQQFEKAFATKLLPVEIWLAQKNRMTLVDDSENVENAFDTYCYDPRAWRKKSLELRIVQLHQTVADMEEQVNRLALPRTMLQA